MNLFRTWETGGIILYVFYADVFVIQNFLVNLIVLMGAARVRKIHGLCRMAGIGIAALTGSVLELLLLLMTHDHVVFLGLSGLVVLPFVTMLALKPQNIREWSAEYGICMLFMMLLGGICEAVTNVLGLHKLSFLVILATGFLLVSGVSYAARYRKLRNSLFQVILEDAKKQVEALALYDSGNRLREPYGGKAVYIVAPEIAEQLGIRASGTKHALVIPYCSLGGSGLLQIYTIDRIRIREQNREYLVEPAVIGLAQPGLMKNKTYQIILNQEVDIV